MVGLANVQEVNIADKKDVVEVLATAFSEYPVFQYVLGQGEPSFGEKIRLLVDFFSDIRYQMGGPPLVIRQEKKAVAAALVDPADTGPFTDDLRRILRGLMKTVGPNEMARMELYERLCKRMEPEQPHYYLGMIGVLPEHQGQGYARRMLDHIHKMVDTDPKARGIALNTENPNNVPIYRYFGYEVIEEAELGPLHTWCMFRPSEYGSQ
jgi:ribosomal protein S18 acetylase RimI-like enzyme